MFKLKFISFAVFLFFNQLACASSQLITIGIQTFMASDNDKWQSTLDFLRNKLPNNTINFHYVPAQNVKNLRMNFGNGKFDYVITQPVAALEIEDEYDSQILLTKLDISGVSEFGSVIFTRRNNSDIKSLNDIQFKRFSAAHPDGLGGWILALDHLAKQGIELDTNPKNELISWDGPQPEIVKNVMSGMSEAGVVRTGVLEKLEKNDFMLPDGSTFHLSDVKVIDSNPQKNFPYLLTTELVKEWAFSATKNDDDLTTKQLVDALLSVNDSDRDKGVFQWNKAEKQDYDSIDKLLKKYGKSYYKTEIVDDKEVSKSLTSLIVFFFLFFLFLIYRFSTDQKPSNDE